MHPFPLHTHTLAGSSYGLLFINVTQVSSTVMESPRHLATLKKWHYLLVLPLMIAMVGKSQNHHEIH